MSRDAIRTDFLKKYSMEHRLSLEKWELSILENLDWNLQMSTWFEAMANITEQGAKAVDRDNQDKTNLIPSCIATFNLLSFS